MLRRNITLHGDDIALLDEVTMNEINKTGKKLSYADIVRIALSKLKSESLNKKSN